ncbi:MAG: hypothetical protein ACP5M4_13000 [Acidobacteriaceae bacterium]
MKTKASITVACSLVLSAGLIISGCNKNNPNNAQNQPAGSQNGTTAQGNPPPPPADHSSGSAPERSRSYQRQQGPSQYQQQQAQSSPAPAPAPVVIPAGTRIEVRTDQDLGSKISRTGDTFTATVAHPVVVNGQVVIPQDSRAEGLVVVAKPLGRFAGNAELALRLERISVGNHSFPVMTSSIADVEKGKGRRTGIMAGGGGALGAIIGGIAGGGKGALIGGLAGAGAGTAGSAFTGNKQIVIPAETLLVFRTDQSTQMQ